MKLAAIDIGSNAARLQISKVLDDHGTLFIKKIEYVRFPLRLGQDVFKQKIIGWQREDMLFKLLHAFKLLMELHEVKDYMVCATSAMREARNGLQVTNRIKQELGLDIEIISGDREAELINTVLVHQLDDKQYLHIDVGGGSTELNIYYNRKKIDAHSFKVGSVRTLEVHDSKTVWKSMEKWVKATIFNKNEPVVAIGTGGNINKLYDLAQTRDGLFIPLTEVQRLHDYIADFSLEDRINKLHLNPDRADVIVPAAEIYLTAMQAAQAQQIMAPDIGLKDGIIQVLYERNMKKVNAQG
ncbi:MAG: phosphatase [Verrucomicrobia bacterium]|nr:phosphatase [Cytophagales bacterium]